MTRRTVKGMEFLNADGSLNTNSAGFRYAIDTLTYIIRQAVEQRFLDFKPSDYMAVDLGGGAWSSEISQPREFYMGDGFFSGEVETHAANGRIAEVSSVLDDVRMPVKDWAKKVSWSFIELQKAAHNDTWDVVSAKTKALKKNWDLGIQEVSMLGHPGDRNLSGLLNSQDVTVNTGIIPIPICEMTAAQIQNFVAHALGAYYDNSGKTVYPDKFVMPTSDYLGLGIPMPGLTGGGFANVSVLQYLEDMFKRLTHNADFQILPNALAEQDSLNKRGVASSRYALYRSDPETLKFFIPVDFTMFSGKMADDNITFTATAVGEFSGVLIARPQEVLYFDPETR